MQLCVRCRYVCFNLVDLNNFWGKYLIKHGVPFHIINVRKGCFFLLNKVVVIFCAVVLHFTLCFPLCPTGNPCGFLQLINITIYCSGFLHELC